MFLNIYDKQNKIIIFLTLIIIFSLCFIGCSKTEETDKAADKEADIVYDKESDNEYSKEEILDIYNQINSNIHNFASVQALLSNNCFINNGNESLELGTSSEIKQKGNEITGADIEIITTTRYLDQSKKVTSYYTQGYYYTDYNEDKVKIPLTQEEMARDNILILPEIEQDVLISAEIEYDADENYTMTLIVDSNKMPEYVNGYLDAFMNDSQEDISLSDATIVIKADKENIIQSCDLLITLNYIENDIENENTIDSYIEYFNVNEKLDIEFPDLSKYKEI